MSHYGLEQDLKRLEHIWQQIQLPDPKEFDRLPGLFRRWELSKVLKTNRVFLIEEAGKTRSGTKLFAIFERRLPKEEY